MSINIAKNKIGYTLMLTLLIFNCDDRMPIDEIEDDEPVLIIGDYKINLIAQAYGFDEYNNAVSVGEDIKGPHVTTYITAELQLLDSLKQLQPQKEEIITFSAKVSGSDIGSFDIQTPITDNDGLVIVKFSDGNVSAYDNPTTPTYEGVEVTALFSKDSVDFEKTETIRFNVYDTSQVKLWPYQLNLTTNTNAIILDGGVTKAALSSNIRSLRYGSPISNVELYFESNNGQLSELSQITDSLGVTQVDFSDTGNSNDIGVSTIVVRFQHPVFGIITDSVQITILETSSGIPAYMEIPSSFPGEITVVGGDDVESTDICARIFDEDGVLVQTPYKVTFTLGPNIPSGANLNNLGMIDSVYSANGEACVALNSGIAPGPVRVTAVLVYEGEEISATAIPVIIATGPPFSIHLSYHPDGTGNIGGGLYRTQAAALVHDRWYNPVEDTTYVYWTMTPVPRFPGDTAVIEADIIGVSFTGNTNLDGDSDPGIAYTEIFYSSEATGRSAYVTALTFGANGDTVSARINQDEGETFMVFVPGELRLSGSTSYVDFTIVGSPVTILITGTLRDYYGNAISEAPVALEAPGATGIYWPIFPIPNDEGITDENGQVTWYVEYYQSICEWIVDTDPPQYQDYTSSITAALLIQQEINSDPFDILFVRTLLPPP